MKIICFGDSLTTCGGQDGRFSDILQDRFPDLEFVNQGVGGESFVEARERLEADVLALAPDIVLLEYGANDWWRDERPCTDWAVDLKYCIERIQAGGAKVVVVGVFGDHRGADGKIRPTYDIFATRDFMKRLYVLTRKRRPQGQINIHNSTVMVIPTLAWGPSTWGGEQLDTHKPGVRTLDILPMDAFRTEFMGRQWGVPSEFLVYENRPYTSRDMLAYTLLHEVLIRPNSDDALARTAPLWRLYDAFPFRGAAFYPYWSNQGLLRCSPAGVYATAYHRAKEGLLIFVSNLGDRDAQAVLELNPAALSWKGLGSARDALNGQPIEVRGAAMHLALPAWRYRALRVRPPAP